MINEAIWKRCKGCGKIIKEGEGGGMYITPVPPEAWHEVCLIPHWKSIN